MNKLVGLATALLLTAGTVCAQPAATSPDRPAPATTAVEAGPALPPPDDFQAMDRPNDAGDGILLTFRKMPYEGPNVYYEVLAATQPDGPFYGQRRIVSDTCLLRSGLPSRFRVCWAHRSKPGAGTKCDCPDCQHHAIEVTRIIGTNSATGQPTPAPLKPGTPYYFKLAVVRDNATAATTGRADGTPVVDSVAWYKANIFVAMLLVSAAILYFAWRARRNPGSLFIRRIAGLEAVEESVGRAAEMGKPIFFCHGMGGVSGPATISAMNILGKIAERVAEFGAEMKVTNKDYLVMQVSQEMVREACVRVGRPDAYKEESIFYVSGEQFSYATAVEGMLIREKPATCFFCGTFAAESLLLSETGAVTKAIQIAGTDSWNQLPFFITTCDYTLIGEELYAASAYLSREPRLLGAIKGQDMAKAAIMALIVIGTGAAVVATVTNWTWVRGLIQLLWPIAS